MHVWKRNTWFLGIALCAIGRGCGSSDGLVCAPVRGQVLMGGKPVAEAMIAFHPLGEHPAEAPRPVAYCNAEGRFTLTTLNSGDGAPPGRYAVTIELREARLVGEEMVRDGQNLLPPAYGDPRRSPVQCEVIAGENAIPPIQIEPR
jgi:hypothetical protein